MKSQQAAEREEQQRIKNLVLNYELDDDDPHDGIKTPMLTPISQPCLESKKITKYAPKTGFDHLGNTFSRAERNGRAPRARRLNLSDVDWYGRRASSLVASRSHDENSAHPETVPPHYKRRQAN